MDKNKTVKIKREMVDLQASGYEWTCPNCKFLNHEVEISQSVKCSACNKEYIVWDIHHTNE